MFHSFVVCRKREKDLHFVQLRLECESSVKCSTNIGHSIQTFKTLQIFAFLFLHSLSLSLSHSLSHTHKHTCPLSASDSTFLDMLSLSLSCSFYLPCTHEQIHARTLTHSSSGTHRHTCSLLLSHKRTYSLLFKDIYSCIVFKGNLKSASFIRVYSSSQNFSPHQKLEIAQVWRKI